MSLATSIRMVAISRPPAVAQRARLISEARALGLTFSAPPMRPNAAIMLATVPIRPSSGPIRTIVEIEASRPSIAETTSV